MPLAPQLDHIGNLLKCSLARTEIQQLCFTIFKDAEEITVNKVMRLAKYLLAPWAGVLIYTLLSVFFGPTGLSAYRQLERELQRQEANVESLRQINRELEDNMSSLLYDRDTLSIYARELGYASRQEHFIRVVGLGINHKNLTSHGELVIAADPYHFSDKNIRIIAVLTGISIAICLIVFDFLKRLKYQENGKD